MASSSQQQSSRHPNHRHQTWFRGNALGVGFRASNDPERERDGEGEHGITEQVAHFHESTWKESEAQRSFAEAFQHQHNALSSTDNIVSLGPGSLYANHTLGLGDARYVGPMGQIAVTLDLAWLIRGAHVVRRLIPGRNGEIMLYIHDTGFEHGDLNIYEGYGAHATDEMGEDLRHRINPKTLLVVPHLDNSALPTDELRQHKPPIIWCSRFHESMRGHPFPEFLIAEYEVMLDWGEPGGQGDNFWIEAVGNTAFWVRKDLHHRHLVPDVSNLLPGMPGPSRR
ncbi:MAG: hypothetical protein Q9162_003748 [Coniocarpon cinnabarinum]